MFYTFWLALDYHHFLCLTKVCTFSISFWLLFSSVLQLGLIWCCKVGIFLLYHIKFLCCHLRISIVLLHVMNSSLSIVISGRLSALTSAYLLIIVCLPTSWATLVLCWVVSLLMWILTVFTVNESFSFVWFCTVGCIILLFMSFHSVTFFTIFCGFHECSLCSLCTFTFLAQVNTSSQCFHSFLSCG